MMKGLFTTLVIILFFVTGCVGDNDQSNDFIVVDVTAKYPKKELILQDFLDVEYIPLETSDEFLTSANIQAINKDVMIFRNMNNDGDIFLFDRKGKGIRKINRLGQGNEEYTYIQGIVLDEDNDEIYVNSLLSYKVLVYDLLGNFKRSFMQKKDLFYDLMGDFERDHLIGHDGAYFYIENGILKGKKKNVFSIISKLDGAIKEIPIPYQEKKLGIVVGNDANGKTITRSMYNRELIPFRDSWVLTEPSADTIYSYSSGHTLKPFIVRTPSIQSMNPEIFLFPGVLTDRYYFLQTVKKEFNFATNTGFSRTDLMYDTQEKAIFECVVYNNDFTKKRAMSLVYEIPMFTIVNKEVAFMKRLEAFELIEAYEKGELKGKLKDIAAGLNEESNPVIMLAKYKKTD